MPQVGRKKRRGPGSGGEWSGRLGGAGLRSTQASFPGEFPGMLSPNRQTTHVWSGPAGRGQAGGPWRSWLHLPDSLRRSCSRGGEASCQPFGELRRGPQRPWVGGEEAAGRSPLGAPGWVPCSALSPAPPLTAALELSPPRRGSDRKAAGLTALSA